MDTQQILSDSLSQTLRERRIVRSDPDIMGGTPVFVGTRVPLQTLFDYIEGDEGLSEFLTDFPHLQVPAFQVLETISSKSLYSKREITNRKIKTTFLP
jgi:uncharacterized protein (DUF433 family)